MAEAPRVLLATHHLRQLAGSEITTLELAEEFRDTGWNVRVATFIKGEPMAGVFLTRGFEILHLVDDLPLILDGPYALAWLHHSPTYHHLSLAGGFQVDRLVYSSLSPFEPLEALPRNISRVDWILANSPETRDAISADLDTVDERLRVFPNAVPSSFWGRARQELFSAPRRIAIVSNHPPTELVDVKALLASAGIEVVHIGAGGCEEHVTPERLLKFDAVVTIGKTIQYCFALRIPVYCYDHYGGPGWLTESNFDRCAYHNFSGRGFSMKTSAQIAGDLTEGYGAAERSLDAWQRVARASFDLRTNLHVLLDMQPVRPRPARNSERHALKATHTVYLRLLAQLQASLAQLQACQRENVALHNYVRNAQTSWWWKLASPLRYVERRIRLWRT